MSRRENRRPSPKQLAARRNNTQQSTGPRTEAGKRRSALNSLKHGRYAKAPVRPIVETIVALGGDPKAFTSLLLGASHQILRPRSRPPNPNSQRGVKGRKALHPYMNLSRPRMATCSITLRRCRRAEAEGTNLKRAGE